MLYWSKWTQCLTILPTALEIDTEFAHIQHFIAAVY